MIETFPIGGLYELRLKAALRRSRAGMRSAGLHSIGLRRADRGPYLLLYWISQLPLDDILLQNRDGRLISLHQARQPGRKILDVPEPKSVIAMPLDRLVCKGYDYNWLI